MPEIIIQYSNQKRKDMNYTISMTDILLAVSVGCNLWFLFLLLYERIMDPNGCMRRRMECVPAFS